MPAIDSTTTSRGRKFTYNIINTQLRERESARALQTIRTVVFLQKLSTIDDVTKYRGIPVGLLRYFRQYIIVGHFLIPRIIAEANVTMPMPKFCLRVQTKV